MANYNLTNQPISASFQQLLQKNDNDFLVDGTGSLVQTLKVTGSVSSSTYYGDGSNLTGISGGGGSTDTGSLLTTASVVDATITFTKGDASQFSIEVDNVTSSLQTQDVFVNVKNTSGSPINKGLAVHAVGVTGENVNIELADSSNSANMPAIGLLEETLADNASGRAIISGRIKNIDTSGLVAGASVYVNGSGTLTSTKPTGSDLIQNIGIAGKINATEGEIIVVGSGRSNDLPNITEGYIWVGDGDGVPEEFSTGSIAFINKDNTFTGTQNFNNISVSGTGSFGYIQSVTGSAKIIGDAFLILNNDTPTERYAGIKVIDSGSANNTSSFQYDGGTDDWFFEKDVLGTAEYGIALFGPEYTTKGTPTYNTNNTIPKGTGGHHLNDSNISDNGSTVSITGDLSVSGTYKGFDSGSFAILNQSNTFTAGPQIASASDGNGYFSSKPLMPTSGFGQKILWEANNQNLSVLGNGNYNVVQESLTHLNGYGRWYDGSWYQEFYNSGFTDGAEVSLNGGGWRAAVAASGSSNTGELYIQDNYDGNTGFKVNAQTIDIGTPATVGITLGASGTSLTIISGSVSASAPISASAFIGDGSQLTGVDAGIFIQTGSYFSTTNDLRVTGSFDVDGGIGGNNVDLTIASQTASLDLRTSNTFTVELVNGTDTHFSVSNFSGTAQSANILVKQPTGGQGTVSFSSDFKFGQGNSFQPTPANAAQDIVSFTRFGNHLYGTFINNFS